MAPPIKSGTKPSDKSAASGIRAFLSTSQASNGVGSTSKATGKSYQKPIEISDDDDGSTTVQKRSLRDGALETTTRTIAESSKGGTRGIKRREQNATSSGSESEPVRRPVPRSSKRKSVMSSEEESCSEGDDIRPKKLKTSKTDALLVSKKSHSKSAGDTKSKGVELLEEPRVPAAKPSTKSERGVNWAAKKAQEIAKGTMGAQPQSGPSIGRQVVPDGKPNCLTGLTFVFTGELASFSREEIQDAAKRFGGRVTTAPSGKTSYVVLGEGAGPKKLELIKKLGLKTVDENGFLDLIATRDGVLDHATIAKQKKEQEKIRQDANDMERREKEADDKARKVGGQGKVIDSSSQLWTTKYAPKTLKEVCGNKGQVEKLNVWLEKWDDSHRCGFKKPGKDGAGMYRAVLITGPPGIGKTTSAHLIAELNGYTVIEVNASDARNKKLLESTTNITNRSLDGWLGGRKATNVAGVEIHGKPLLIMDEVDGMSGGDRGGVGALNALIKKTDLPIICIANDRNSPKLKPLASTTFGLPFRRPSAMEIRSRMMSIAFKEKLKVTATAVDQLAAGSNSDVRQMLNMLSTFKLTGSTMDFDDSKELSETNQKYSVMTPFAVLEQMFGPYMFSPSSTKSLNDKMDLYFHDFSLVPLMIQENYLKTGPRNAANMTGSDLALKRLELIDAAAAAISDGDLVDAMIHSPEQHWTLMPLHAVNSAVRPASQIYGSSSTWGGPNAMSFPSWLGQNSKQGKLKRQLGDIQIRMRLKVTGDKAEIRQHYIPSLYPALIQPLIDRGSDAISSVIDLMDAYYLSKEEWDYVVELGLGERQDEAVLKNIPTATKSAFTRKYNSSEHPVAFHKATLFGKAKAMAVGPAPDMEDAYDIDDELPVGDEEDAEDADSNDVTKDKLIKASKAKKPTKQTTSSKPKAKPKGRASKAGSP